MPYAESMIKIEGRFDPLVSISTNRWQFKRRKFGNGANIVGCECVICESLAFNFPLWPITVISDAMETAGLINKINIVIVIVAIIVIANYIGTLHIFVNIIITATVLLSVS